jgi:biotin carboxylase
MSNQRFRYPVPAKRILVIGDDMRSFLACVRSFGRLGVEVHAAPFEWRSGALKSKYIKRIHHLPRIGANRARWVEAVRELQDVYDYDLIVPCDERALLPLVAVSDDEKNFVLAEPGALARNALFDKIETRRLAEKLNIPVAKGIEIFPVSLPNPLAKKLGSP